MIENFLKSFLRFSGIYSFLMNLLGSKKAMKWYLKEVLKVRDGDKVVDIGCGPGSIRAELPESVEYVGFDPSPEYIETAKKKYRNAVFLHGTAGDFCENPLFSNADIVLCNGVLHHVNDEEVIRILKFAEKILKKNGRLILFEPCYLLYQSRFSKWVMSKDRGDFIRQETHLRKLVKSVFPDTETWIVTGRILIPYIHIVLISTLNADSLLKPDIG